MPPPDLDAISDPEQIVAIADQINRGVLRAAESFFPERPKGYVTATRLIARYSVAKAAAMKSEGDEAQQYLAACEAIYADLPDFARWRR